MLDHEPHQPPLPQQGNEKFTAPPPQPNMIEVDDLFFEYPGRRVLDGISFTLPRQSITALVGNNGVGKTTLMRSLAGLHPPFSGQIRVAGIDVIRHPRRCHRKIGYLADFFGLYDDLTVSQCLLHAARAHGLSPQDASQLRDGAVERLGLSAHINSRSGHLSRGLRQRLAIGQAIVHEPQVLLLDEPASGLDPDGRRALSQLLLELQEYGMTIMVSSHILAELEEYSSHMLVLRDRKHIDLQPIMPTPTTTERRLRLMLSQPYDPLLALLQAHPAISEIETNQHRATFLFLGSALDQQQLLHQLVVQQVPIYSLSEERLHLQDAYLRHMHSTPSEETALYAP
ncbi:ABC transporter related protein [Magnetococcus marinus MC-1]|uniref:ABC transporter related protein n=1 Tax=Magnetococcus marinus (strain ATCC BAA-1437 / JCM 17883 / MC-1) TaxID=156889 RepID=A0L8M4_MAGMM|nr:ABC transporter ATP-binding protein [Magnetococcus marinus]ABK44317.1 ABC transporter related protein [Magnetococcus marinus MC-1]